MQEVVQRFRTSIDNQVIELNRGYSTEVGKSFPDHYFDWIYIDTTHSYKTTKEELELYARKVKEGGISAGHDFVVWNWRSDLRYGVIEAVYEFCVRYIWELIYLTTEMYAPSFGIKKDPVIYLKHAIKAKSPAMVNRTFCYKYERYYQIL